jgi:hypothetical protein
MFVLRAMRWLMLISLAPAFSATGDESLEGLAQQLKNELQGLAKNEEAAVAPVKSVYVKELTRLRGVATAKGDLDLALQIDAALKSVEAGGNPAKGKSDAALETAGTVFERNKAAALRPWNAQRARMLTQFKLRFDALEQKHMRAGDLEQAKKVRETRTSLVDGPSASGVMGEWKAEASGYSGVRIFKANGVVSRERGGDGTWTIEGKNLVVRLGSATETYPLPVVPEAWKGRTADEGRPDADITLRRVR